MTKVQFNPNTLKASYVAANNKAQTVKLVGDDCEHCNVGETPARLKVRFSGLAFCGCVTSLYREWLDGDNGINNVDYLIHQDSSTACYWDTTFPASDKRARTKEYHNYDCDTGNVDADYHGPLKIEVYRNSASTIILRASIEITGGGWIFHTGEEAPVNCADISGSIPNALVIGNCNQSGGGAWDDDPFDNAIGKVIGYGGSVTIDEIWD